MESPQGKNILVIDDSLDSQLLLSTLLEAKGHSVFCFSNGREALAWLQSLTILPDVILVDLRMPVMNGFEFLDLQRRIPKLKDIPTIVMSGDESKGANLNHRSRIFLKKPFNIGSVLTAIEGHPRIHKRVNWSDSQQFLNPA
jgi:CheY-like chemotaxis protein